MTPVPHLTPALRAYLVRLLVLVALLALVVGVALGYRWMTVTELTSQAVQGLVAGLVGAGVVRR